MRIYIKRSLGILLLCLTALLSACSASSDVKSGVQAGSVPEQTAETAEELPPVRIGVLIYDFNDQYMKVYKDKLYRYLEETYQVQVTVADGENNQEKQDSQIDQMIEDGYDALIVNAVEVFAVKTIVDKCREAQIPVVFINREPEQGEILRWQTEGIAAAYVGADARQSGTLQGELILSMPDRGDLNGDGLVSYVMIQGPAGNKDTEFRSLYSVMALVDGGMQTKELFRGQGGWDQEKGRELTAEALERYGNEIEVIFCNNDAMANGAMEAVETARRNVGKDIYLVGVDALEETVGFIKQGRITGTVLNDLTGQIRSAAQIVMKMINKEKTEPVYYVDYIKIIG